MQELMLILSGNTAWAEMLKRTCTGAPLVESLRNEAGTRLSVVSCSTRYEIEQIAETATIRLVLLDSPYSGKQGMDLLMEGINKAVFPSDVRYLFCCWESPDVAVNEAFVLYHPIQLSTLAQHIQMVRGIAVAEWLARQHATQTHMHAHALHAELRSIRHKYKNAIGVRMQMLRDLVELETPECQQKQLRRVSSSRTGKSSWVEEHLSDFVSLWARHPGSILDAPLQRLRHRTQMAFESLLGIASDALVRPLDHQDLPMVAERYSVVMQEAKTALDKLLARLEPEEASGEDTLCR